MVLEPKFRQAAFLARTLKGFEEVAEIAQFSQLAELIAAARREAERLKAIDTSVIPFPDQRRPGKVED
jgi:hypothetical protein